MFVCQALAHETALIQQELATTEAALATYERTRNKYNNALQALVK